MHLDCAPINVFIGPPNSGKSNILEALELPSLSVMMPRNGEASRPDDGSIDCKRHFRVSEAHELFYFYEFSKPISIIGNLDGLQRGFFIEAAFERDDKLNNISQDFLWRNWLNDKVPFSSDFIGFGQTKYNWFGSSYRFTDDIDLQASQNFYHGELNAPYGTNLGATIRMNPNLQELFVEHLSESNGTELVVDKATGKLSIQMRTQAGLIVSLPYQTLSDTMRRMIFYTAAIRTSRDHIIILEEPEALSFPPYISQLAKEIIEAANQKQFFINTHSPYLLNTFIEQTPKDKLAVFVCSYSKEEKQTKARRLTQEELSEVLDYGVDLFFNLNPYLNDPTEHSM